MKVLIVGSEKPWACENYYIKHLQAKGVNVDFFPARDIFYDYYYRLLFNKIWFRLGASPVYKSINRRLIEYIGSRKFDVVWIFKGMELYPLTLRKIKDSGAKLVNFNPDHPFIHPDSGSGNNNVLKSIGEYDLHLCYNQPVKEQIEKDYHLNCVWLPFGFENTRIVYPEEQTEIKRACFIGNPDANRAKILKKLAAGGLPLTLFGNNWKKWIKPKPHYDIQFFDAIYKEEFNEMLSPYRLHLNIFRPHNMHSHNMRSFEIPGLGGIMLAPDSKEHRLLFNNGENIMLYRSVEEMEVMAKEILEMPYKRAMEIRKSAYAHAMSSGYTYESRSREVLKQFERLLNE